MENATKQKSFRDTRKSHTKFVQRTRQEKLDASETTSGVKQGCILSILLLLIKKQQEKKLKNMKLDIGK